MIGKSKVIKINELLGLNIGEIKEILKADNKSIYPYWGDIV